MKVRVKIEEYIKRTESMPEDSHVVKVELWKKPRVAFAILWLNYLTDSSTGIKNVNYTLDSEELTFERKS